MKKSTIYKRIKEFFGSSERKDKINNGSISMDEIILDDNQSHGFQLKGNDLGSYLSNFLDKEQARTMLNNINSAGYLDSQIGMTLKGYFENQNCDIYIKSVHDSQIESIFSEGIRCYGTSSSLATTNPDTIDKVRLNNTIEHIQQFPILIARIKSNNGFSQGFNIINGTLILQIPKNTSKEEMLYFNEETQTYNIKPDYLIGFLPVDENQIVGNWVLPKQILKDNTRKGK